MQTWLSEGRPAEKDLALALAQVVVAIGALNCRGIHSNDALFRNILVRSRPNDGAARRLTKYDTCWTGRSRSRSRKAGRPIRARTQNHTRFGGGVGDSPAACGQAGRT